MYTSNTTRMNHLKEISRSDYKLLVFQRRLSVTFSGNFLSPRMYDLFSDSLVATLLDQTCISFLLLSGRHSLSAMSSLPCFVLHFHGSLHYSQSRSVSVSPCNPSNSISFSCLSLPAQLPLPCFLRQHTQTPLFSQRTQSM